MPEPLVRRAGLLDDEPGLHVLPLSTLLLKQIGPEYLTWSSEGLRAELEEHYGQIGPLTWERIQALRILQSHDAYWKEWEIFEKVTAAICGEFPIFHLTQPPEAEEIAVSLSVAAKIDHHPFDADLQRYIVAACLTDGLWYFEPPISEAVGDARSVYDQRNGITRADAAVAGELAKSSQHRPESDDPVLTQVNRVLDVRHVLGRYNEAVDEQLKKLGG